MPLHEGRFQSNSLEDTLPLLPPSTVSENRLRSITDHPDFYAPSTFEQSDEPSAFPSPPPSPRGEANTEPVKPADSQPRHGKFQNEEEYLAALKAWAETKMYMEPERGLVGFYGKETIQDIINRPGGGFRSQAKDKKNKQSAQSLDQSAETPAERPELQQQRRKSSISQWIERRRRSSRPN